MSSFLRGLSFGGGDAAIGLSIGSSAIKVVELKRARKGWKLLHFGMIQLPEETVVDREIVNHIAVVDSLKNLVRQLKLRSKNVCTSISGTSVIVKRMKLDVPNVKELQDQVFWEAEQYLPFDVSEVSMDFQLLSRTQDGRTDVVLAAAKNTALDAYLSCIEDAGLKAKIMDVDFFALQNLFEANYPTNPSEAVALVDVGASAIKIVVVHNGIPVFTKDTSIGGKNLTHEIQKHLNLSFQDAEALKVGGAQSGGMPQEVSDLMSIMAENFASEIKRALDFYNASSTGAPVSYVLLGGGSAKIADFPRTVEETVGLASQLINPFNAITYDSSVFSDEYVSSIAPIAAVPMGLALRIGTK